VTGGNSFCFVDFNSKLDDNKNGQLTLKAAGEYALHGLEIKMTDNGAIPGNSHVGSSPPIPTILFLPKQGERALPPIPVRGKKLQLYKFDFSSLNGVWTEDLAIYDQNGTFVSAYRVTRARNLLQEFHDPRFPLVNEQVDFRCFEKATQMPQTLEQCAPDSK
jgi:hypothetical protein